MSDEEAPVPVEVDDTTEPPSARQRERARANREAQGYRTRLRQAEAERDALSARVAAMHERAVLDVAAASLAVPRDLLDHGGLDVAAVVDDQDRVDVEAVRAAAVALAAQRPGLARPIAASAADVGLGVAGSGGPSATSWSSVVKHGAVTPTDGRGL